MENRGGGPGLWVLRDADVRGGLLFGREDDAMAGAPGMVEFPGRMTMAEGALRLGRADSVLRGTREAGEGKSTPQPNMLRSRRTSDICLIKKTKKTIIVTERMMTIKTSMVGDSTNTVARMRIEMMT